jgi:Fe2+ transport system protein FeoA
LSVLSDLEAGGEAILVSLNLPPAVSNHLMYMGFVPDAQIKMLRRAPAGDPTVYVVDGMVVALRHETAKSIQVKPVTQTIHQLEQPAAKLAEEDDLGVGAQVGVRG